MNISGSGTVEVKDGNFIIGDRDASGAQGVGTLNQTGGIFTIDAGAGLFLAGYGNGNTYNLTGGTLQVGGNDLVAQYGTGSYAFNLGGGTIQVIGSDLTTDVSPTLVNNTTSFINTNGFNASFSGAITGTGGQLVKIGTGTLEFNNANNTIGSFLIAGGNVTQAGSTLTTSEMAVGDTGKWR